MTRSFAAFLVVTVLACIAGGCAEAVSDADDLFIGDASFGSPGDPTPREAGVSVASDAAVTPSDAGVSGGSSVRLRVHQAVINLPNARFCHDPDYVVDDPSTPGDESKPGAAAAAVLAILDGGSVAFGETTAYVLLPALLSGAITVHRVPTPDAGGGEAGSGDASAPSPPDGGVLADAGAALDGGMDAGSLEAGSMDAGAPDAGDPCDPSMLEAVLPLPATSSWFYPEGVRDGGAELERLGIVSVAMGGDTLTLFGSGLSLDRVELTRRAEAARQAYLAVNPGMVADADTEARRQTLLLEGTYGPRFLLARGLAPISKRFALSLAHLVPDVPSSTYQSRPAAADAGSGALRLCVTVDKKESEPGDGGVARFEYRSVTPVGAEFDPNLSYRFRLFAESEYLPGMDSCATTSLKPVAKLDVDAGSFFEADRSYTLVASGAVAPASTCTNLNATKLIRQDCARAVEAQLQLLPTELSATP